MHIEKYRLRWDQLIADALSLRHQFDNPCALKLREPYLHVITLGDCVLTHVDAYNPSHLDSL